MIPVGSTKFDNDLRLVFRWLVVAFTKVALFGGRPLGVAVRREHDHKGRFPGVALLGRCLGRLPRSFSFLGVGVLSLDGLFPPFLVVVLSLVSFPVEIPQILGKLRGIPVGVPIWEFWDESWPRWMETRPVVVGSR